jgi:hypothetical protein
MAFFSILCHLSIVQISEISVGFQLATKKNRMFSRDYNCIRMCQSLESINLYCQFPLFDSAIQQTEYVEGTFNSNMYIMYNAKKGTV